jgi:hypothetical protein
MQDLEHLLDALSAGPRDAVFLAEKIARKERDSLNKEALLQTSNGALARQTLRDLPPIGHPLTPLLAVLTWLDAHEVVFLTMVELVRFVSSGAWYRSYKRLVSTGMYLASPSTLTEKEKKPSQTIELELLLHDATRVGAFPDEQPPTDHGPTDHRRRSSAKTTMWT